MKRILSFVAVMAFALFTASQVFAQAKTLSIDEVLTNGEQYVDQEITVSGLCSHLCSHGGRKMFLRSKAGLLRVNSNKEIGAFSTDAINEPVEVTGVLKETRIDETYLQAWEDRIKNGNAVGQHSGCETESAARGEVGATDQQKIDNFRQRIAERKAAEGKAYLSTFYVIAKSYKIL